jgi:hypothetical protein
VLLPIGTDWAMQCRPLLTVMQARSASSAAQVKGATWVTGSKHVHACYGASKLPVLLLLRVHLKACPQCCHASCAASSHAAQTQHLGWHPYIMMSYVTACSAVYAK